MLAVATPLAVRLLGHVFAIVLAAVPTPTQLTTAPAPNDDGRHVQIAWQPSASPMVTGYRVYRSIGFAGYGLADTARTPDMDPRWWVEVKTVDKDTTTFVDEVPEAGTSYRWGVRALAGDLASPQVLASPALVAGPDRPVAAWFDLTKFFIALVIVTMLALLAIYFRRARTNPKQMYIRRIPGIDALEEAIGRSTEMGRPVLYVPGIEEIQDIQTIASLLILGHVAELAARYETELRVACAIPLTMVVAEEIVRQGFATAGHPDAHRPQNVQFISSEQFAFTAGVSGLILREKPATNIYLGRFYAESLILAETGYLNKSIQIAGTAEITQLPFFIAACDYTLLGEELYAVSAYVSREPRLMSTLKTTDTMKLGILAIILVGVAMSTISALWPTAHLPDLAKWLLP